MKVISIVVFLLFACFLSAQGPVITPLKGNARLKSAPAQVSSKRALADTVQLPFFDDFTTTGVYPDMTYWMDSQAYVNTSFPISPPSYGVATLDNLNKKGAPYRGLSGNSRGASDSLTSRYINLRDFKSGVNTLQYKIADSIYLSFFFQAQGIGDPLDASDSLVLKFKDAGGDWRTVWKTSGTSVKPFRQVLVGVLDAMYLNPGFQFRFINFGKNTGNMNQWHLDYVRMKSGRNRYDTLINDVAINAVPVGPLRIYESMPYNHFKAAQGSNQYSFHEVRLRNNSGSGVNVQYKCEVRDQANNLVANYPLSASARNISPQSDSSERFNQFSMAGLPDAQPTLRLKYTISPGSNDNLPSLYNSTGDNNEFTKTVNFRNYLAYDDGSAEGGYGLDYGSLPAGPAYSALRFELFKPDTLRGLSIFFNRSVADVSFKPFTLLVWQNITEPPANNTNNDVILKRIEMVTTRYTDSINGFYTVILDTAVILPTGTFFIGWQQTSNYILNIGYDNNYKYLHQGGRNPNLYYNLNGYWEKVNSTISGVPMIRPLLGPKLYNPASVRQKVVMHDVMIYPNPSGNSRALMIESGRSISSVKVFDISGKVSIEMSGDDISEINVSDLPPGFYQVLVTDRDNHASIHKYIRN
jgi:hypothetical protein